MSKLVVVSGDQAVFDAKFGGATVAAPPGIITGTSRAKVGNAVVCVRGDEASVVVTTATYVTTSFPTPGAGVLTISALAEDQQASSASSAQRGAILVGSQFRARFQVTAPASAPGSPPPTDAPGRVYSGTGSFVTANRRTRAT